MLQRKVKTKAVPIPLRAVRVHGEFDRRVRRLVQHLVDIRRFLFTFEYGGWGADQYGRWLEALSVIRDYLPEVEGVVRSGAPGLLRGQEDDGGFAGRSTWGPLIMLRHA